MLEEEVHIEKKEVRRSEHDQHFSASRRHLRSQKQEAGNGGKVRIPKPTAASYQENFSWTPSGGLIAALKASRHANVSPVAYPHKVDLSHSNPRIVWRRNRPSLNSRRPQKRALVRSNEFAISPNRLQALLAKYIETVDPIFERGVSLTASPVGSIELDEALTRLYTDDAMALLESKGYGVEDLMTWAWIITADNSELAAIRLVALNNSTRSSDVPRRNVPTFVFLFILRRRLSSVRALKLLLVHGWDRLKGRPGRNLTRTSVAKLDNTLRPDSWSMRRWKYSDAAEDQTLKMDETTAIIMVVRLLRHARLLWPQAIVSIAAMISTHVDGSGSSRKSSPPAVLSDRIAARLTFVYNRALSLLCLPSSRYPLQSVAYYQRAQFNLIKRMAQFEPALIINREGYRAIVRVQLAHRKTLKERAWARMQAKSWPPWKEEKLGIDVEKGIEDGISRASEVLARSKEAGYSNRSWEKVASVYSGWDTDHSPTIQTRIILRRPSVFRFLRSSGSKNGDHESSDDGRMELWASRIRAIRTLQEAWACFLACTDENSRPSQTVYYAMFEKLVFHSKLRRQIQPSEKQEDHDSRFKDIQEVLPGDSKEINMAPVSPQEATYVRSQPPSIDELFDSMIKGGIPPDGRCLAFLVSHAGSLEGGLRYLRSSRLSPRMIKALTTQDVNGTGHSIADLRSLPDYIFAAFIQLLCRFPTSATFSVDQHSRNIAKNSMTAGNSQAAVSRRFHSTVTPLLHAVRLMNLRNPQYRPPWNFLLSALARSGLTVDSSHHNTSTTSQEVIAWRVMVEIERQMSSVGLALDSQGFQIICIGLEKAVKASQRTSIRASNPSASSVSRLDAQAPSERPAHKFKPIPSNNAIEVLENGTMFVKVAFARLVGLTDVPNPPHLALKYPRTDSLNEGEPLESTHMLPRLLDVPGPSALHAYVRVLGFVQDYDALLAVLRWMADYAPELQAVIDESRNGESLFRRTLIATRVFLERSWILLSEQDGDQKPYDPPEGAPEHVVQQVYQVIGSMDGWGGWPTDDEVEAYCHRGRFS